MTGEFVLYLALGKLLIWTGQKFGRGNFNNRFLLRLFDCQFCLGVWVMTITALLFKINILSDVFPYVPILSEVVTGVVSSFLLHLLTLGWREQFDVVVI